VAQELKTLSKLLLFLPKSGTPLDTRVSIMIARKNEQAADDSPVADKLDSWTCYSSGESTTERVMEAAENPLTPPDTLALLAESCDVKVRMAVADNRSAFTETTMLLAQDEDADLRYQLAENHGIDESVLEVLADDSNPFVAHRARKTISRVHGGTVHYMTPKLRVIETAETLSLSPRELMARKMQRMPI
jgi:hypothetical protein